MSISDHLSLDLSFLGWSLDLFLSCRVAVVSPLVPTYFHIHVQNTQKVKAPTTGSQYMKILEQSGEELWPQGSLTMCFVSLWSLGVPDSLNERV